MSPVRRRVLAIVAGAVAVAVAIGVWQSGTGNDSGDGPSASEAIDRPPPGVLVWAFDGEPQDLHVDDPANDLIVTAWIRQALLEDLYGVTSDTSYYPELLAGEAVLTENPDGSVTAAYELRSGLTWSDGDPLTATDVEFTYDVIMEIDQAQPQTADGAPNYVYLMGERTGYELITNFTEVSDTRFTVTWSSFYPGWKSLFPNVYPAHAFSAGGAAAVNEALRTWTNADGEILPSSGPMVFQEWSRGDRLTLVRNEQYHGSTSPEVTNEGLAEINGVQILWVDGTSGLVDALRNGRAHLLMTPQPQPELRLLREDGRFSSPSTLGPVFEHLGFNLLNPHLAKPEVRQAIALAVDKSAIVTQLYEPLFGELIPPDGLGNTYWMTNQPEYEDHQPGLGVRNLDEAATVLEQAGYAKNELGIYEHPADGPLSLRIGTTGGDTVRETEEELLRGQLADAGIEITIDNVEGAQFFSERLFAEDALAAAHSGGADGDAGLWDIALFSRVGGPWPGRRSDSFRTASVDNPYGFSDPDFDARATECDLTVDEAARAACYNELDRIVTEPGDGRGLIAVPLTQRPSFYAVNTSVLAGIGIAPDVALGGPLANVVDFGFPAP